MMRSWLLFYVLLALSVLAGCASSERVGPESTVKPGQQTSSPAAQCAALDPDACRDSQACQVVRGARMVARANDHCLDPRQVLGCIPSQLCGEALTYFCDPEGEVYQVNTTCGPTGWSECPAPEPHGACTP